MTASHDSGLLLYEAFYGLGEKPFSLSTDPRFLFKSTSHAPVFERVLAGIRRREGLVVLTGETGMGKTTLCRSVIAALDRKTFSAFVPDPVVTREDLLKVLLVEFGVVPADDLARGRLQGASRAELGCALHAFLRSLEPIDAFAVLLVDEAQRLPSSLLDELRILADLEGTGQLLQVVLIGQPELSGALQQPRMRQVAQRVTTHCELKPLDRDGVHGYVRHRLAVAGASADRLLFTGEALDLVSAASGGVPRAVNRLCDLTLQRGHRAHASAIGLELVRAAMADLQLAIPSIPAAVASPVTSIAAASAVTSSISNPRRMMATAALIVLGAMSGLSLAIYWKWAGPMVAARGTLPAVRRPSMRIAAPLPPVLEPAIETIGDSVAAPQEPDEEAPEAGLFPPRAVIARPR